jgi:hypothetical protein
MFNLENIINELINNKIDKKEAIYRFDVLLCNSIDIPARLKAREWITQLENELITDNK